jgi:GLPGLI family protein
MKKAVIAIAACMMAGAGFSQIITKAVIEFEVRTNVHKTMSDDSWADKMREAIPQFSVKYYDFIFAGNKSVYRFNRNDESIKFPSWMDDGSEENVWYSDFDSSRCISQHILAGQKHIVIDSLRKIKWRITTESRVIAGFNCRKAVGRIFDSVYVFAFYTDDIMITGGPVSISGLPGMIMGLTIPRMYTSYVATKVQVVGVEEKKIVPPGKGKYKTGAEMRKFITQRTENWSEYRDKFIWAALL